MTLGNLKLGALGVLLSFAILITNVVVPSFTGHPSRDNNFSESIGDE